MKIAKKYIVEFTQDENGGLHTKRQNYGFNDFEILGMLEFIKIQITEIMTGKIQIPIENTKVSIVDKNRVTIDFIIKNCDISARLKSALKGYVDYFGTVYLDQVENDLMRKRIRNVGRGTEQELIKLKQKYSIIQED